MKQSYLNKSKTMSHDNGSNSLKCLRAVYETYVGYPYLRIRDNELAEFCNVSVYRIRKWLPTIKKFYLDIMYPSETRKTCDEIDLRIYRQLLFLYLIDCGFTISKIADRLDVPYNVIYNWYNHL